MTRYDRFTWEPLPAGVEVPTEPMVASPFFTSWSTTLDDLDRECNELGADVVVVQLDIDRSALRQDGQIRANARPRSGRVRVSFESRRGPLTFAMGRYTNVGAGRGAGIPAWQHNVRAIAKTLESLRAVERYGVVESGEQYQGFLAIEPSPTAPFSDADSAARWVRTRVGAHDVAPLRTVVRQAQRDMHPDVAGDRSEWDLLEQAIALMRAGGVL